MRLTTWMKYNEFSPAYASLFADFWGPGLFAEEEKAETDSENSPSKTDHTPIKKQPLTPAERRELARILAKEIIFD